MILAKEVYSHNEAEPVQRFSGRASFMETGSPIIILLSAHSMFPKAEIHLRRP